MQKILKIGFLFRSFFIVVLSSVLFNTILLPSFSYASEYSSLSNTQIENHDFEMGDLTGWTIVSGNAFSNGDVTSDVNWAYGSFNHNGAYHLWGYKEGGDNQVGILKSSNFMLSGNGQVNLMVSGGNDIENLYVSLVRASDGAELYKATGRNTEKYKRVYWDASEFIGTECYIKAVDNKTGGWAHINIDDVNLGEEPPMSITNFDFDYGDLTGWTVVSGNAFSDGDVTSDVNWAYGSFNHNGPYHLWGYKEGGDDQVGILKSSNFILEGNGQVNLMVSGGNDIENLYVALVRASDGAELYKATGRNTEEYKRVYWDASKFIGTECYIKAVDSKTGGWAHINIDDVNLGEEALSIYDDFKTDSGLWEYHGNAYRVDEGHVVLTRDGANEFGAIWLNKCLNSPFSVSFEYKIGGGNGPLGQADGIVFLFNKEEVDGEPGCYIGFGGKGYGVEIDGFKNEWDPSEAHIALVKDHISNHLTSTNDNRVEDDVWHKVTVDVGESSVLVAIDGDEVISWEGGIDTSYNGLGFSAASGWGYDWHRVRNFSLTSGTRGSLDKHLQEVNGEAKNCAMGNDPVNLSTGNFTQKGHDFNIPTKGQPLEFTRFYNSLDQNTGPLGKGWTHNYNTRLTFNEDSSIAVSYADGHVLYFENSGSVYITPPGYEETLSLGPDNTYVLTFKDKFKQIFNSVGQLISIADKNGSAITLSYTGGLLSSAAGPAGRSLIFAYDPSGRISGITGPDGQTVSYTYDAGGNLATVQDVRGGITRYTYNQYGLTDIIEPNGNTFLHNEYDSQGRVTSQANGSGNISTFAYDTTNRRTTLTDPAGNEIINFFDEKYRTVEIIYPGNVTEIRTYGEDGFVSAKTDKNGNTTNYNYDSRGNLLTLTDPLNNTTGFAYDERDNLVQVTNQLGMVTGFNFDDRDNPLSVTVDVYGLGVTTSTVYNEYGRPVSNTGPSGGTTTYTYDEYGNKTSVTDPLGGTTTFTYDIMGRVLTKTDPRGNTTTYTYDDAGNLLTVTDPLGNGSTMAYDANGNLTEITDPDGNVTCYEYNDNNKLIKVTDPLGNITTYEYDVNGNLKTKTDPLGRVTGYGYDFLDRLTSVTYPDNTAETLTLDGNGNLIAKTDPRGNTTNFEYDALNRLTRVTDPEGGAATTQYDPLGNVTAVTDQRGSTTTFTYNSLSRLLSVADPLGHITSYTYDSAGNKTSATNAKGATWNYTYDMVGRPLTVTDPLGHKSSTGYDSVGNAVYGTNANGHTTFFGYDPLNRLEKVTDTMGNITQYTYDQKGNLETATNAAGHTTTYSYDALSRLLGEINPLGQTRGFKYDPVGNITARTKPDGAEIKYSYDMNKQLTAITYPDSSQVSYGYDSGGNRTSMTDLHGTTSYSRDSLGRITAVERNGNTIGYQYDPAGNITGITYPDGLVINYGYNELNQPVSVTGAVYGATIAYDELGLRSQEILPNGITVGYHYDEAGRLTSITHARGEELLSGTEYTYDSLGNKTAATDQKGNTTSYTYDALNQLTGVQYPGGNAVDYTYDPVGNRTSAGGVSYSYDADNRLVMAGGVSYNYDPNGNLISVGDSVYCRYDYEDRLAQYSMPTCSFDYTYDGDGNRTGMSVSGSVYGATEYIYDINAGLPLLLVEKDNSGNENSYIYAGRILGRIGPEGQLFYHQDGLGSISVITDVYGNTLNRYTYDAFGNLLSTDQSYDNIFGFTGEPRDPSGLIFLRARYYDPSTGRFISRDTYPGTITDPLSMNVYEYCSNNPVNYIDPSGRTILGSMGSMGPIGDAISKYENKKYTTLEIDYSDIQDKIDRDIDRLNNWNLGVVNTYTTSNELYKSLHEILVVNELLIIKGDQYCPGDKIRAQETLQTYLQEEEEEISEEFTQVAIGMSGSGFKGKGGKLANIIGLEREQRVAQIVGGELFRKKIPVVGFGRVEIDVRGPLGELIGVGGPAKAGNLSKLGNQLKNLKAAANQENVSALYYFEEGTPLKAINLAKRWLGEENVFIFK